MDLDKLKKVWIETSANVSSPPTINKENVFALIHSKGRTALEKLTLIETICTILILPFIALPYIHGLVFPRLPYPFFLKYGYVALCIAGFLWQLYKINALKKIDVEKDGILNCSKYILQYKIYIKWEILVGLVLLFVFLFSFVASYVNLLPTEKDRLFFCIFNVVQFMAISFLTFLFYKRFYLKRIKELTAAIEEVKELEKDATEENEIDLV